VGEIRKGPGAFLAHCADLSVPKGPTEKVAEAEANRVTLKSSAAVVASAPNLP